MRARVAAGRISEEDLPQPEVEVVDEAEAGEAGDIDRDFENMDLEALEAEAEALGLDFNEVDGELADEEDQAG
jgi:N utilization substance protein A